MPDKGIQIIVALLEKRESYRITKNSDQRLVHELLRAQRLGYVEQEAKSALYTLSEKGRKLVYSGFYQEDNPPPDTKMAAALPADNRAAPPPSARLAALANEADLRPAYASAALITAMFLLTILVIWLFDLG